ncbi:MAG: SpoVR family protein [Acidobacteria bacterium]|nr:SpoVR family protein [Acidobacteriota bacterium]MCA1627550.1 SpoVR family protein [Acidobacteriota bacterium]
MEDREIKELETAVEQIWDVARDFGLDPYPTNFEIVPATVMYEVGSYALPGRYSHWTFGKAYHRMKTMYDFGLSKIYEVVINTNPSYGFLLETNSPIQNKMVIAHVLGHVDFFKNNSYFSKTNRRMVESVSTHAQRMMEYEFKYGRKTVERFLDSVLAIEEHIDPYFFIKREVSISEEKRREEHRHKDGRYDDLWLLDERRAAKVQAGGDDSDKESEKTPQEQLPEKDLLFYIMKNSPSLAPWQRDAIAMVHEEMEYFVPQMQTKIMNEGWASIWHARIMRALDLSTSDHIEFANLHSGVVSPQKGQLNPYYLGYKIYEDIERRWNEPTAEDRKKFGRRGSEGRDKIFEVRELENDVSFLRNYLTEELCEELDLFVFELIEEEEWTITEKRWEKVRDQLVSNMTNFGFPYLQVKDGDYNGNRELYLKHRYEGTELDMRYARKALEHVHALWGRPVHLETVIDDESSVLHFNGNEHAED